MNALKQIWHKFHARVIEQSVSLFFLGKVVTSSPANLSVFLDKSLHRVANYCISFLKQVQRYLSR